MRWLAALAVILVLAPAAAARAQPVPPPTAAPPAAPAPAPAAIVPPRLLEEVTAVYPPDALAGGRAARVVLALDVGVDGQAANVQVQTPPAPGFDDAALAAARRLRFAPATLDGKPVAVRIQYAFNFAPPAAPPPPAARTPEEVTLTGTVRERGTRRKLAGIELVAQEQSAVTDAQGRFQLALAPGDVEIVIAAAGYQRFAVREKIAAHQRTEVAYLLEPLYASPLEATVAGERQRSEISKTSLATEEIARIPGAQGDALKVIEDLPGVARTSPIGGGALVIRGSNPIDSGVFLDGEQIPLLYHFGALTSTVNPDLLEGIDYLPGNFSSYFGDIKGGLIEVKTRKLRDEPHGYANLSLIDTSLLLESKVPGVEGLTFALAGRRSYFDLILQAVVPSGGDVGFSVAPRYYDAQLVVQYRPPQSRHLFSLSAITSDDVLKLLFSRPADFDPNVSGGFEVETRFTQLRLKHAFSSGRFTLETVAMVEWVKLLFAIGAENFLLDAPGYHLRSTATVAVADALELAGGIDLGDQRPNVSARVRSSGASFREGDPGMGFPRPDEVPFTVARTYDRFVPAAWAEARWRPFPALLLTPGVRVESYRYTDQRALKTAVQPRLTARLQLTETVGLKAGAGLYTQGAKQGDPAPPFGNPELVPEKAWQTTVGLVWKPLPAVDLNLDGFYVRHADLVGHSPDPKLVLDNAAVGNSYGVEVLLRHALSERFFGWLSYSLSRSERRDRPGARLRLFDVDQTHNLTLIASYKLGAGWQAGARLRLISGSPDTPVLGARYLAPSDTYLPIYGLVDSERLPLFHALDLRVDKVWTFDDWTLDLYLDVVNAYNHRSIEGTAYSYDYSQKAYFQGLPILPSLGLKGSF